MRVDVSGPHGIVPERKTSPDGAYELYGLAPGKYSVSIKPPRGLKTRFPVVTGSVSITGDETAVELKPDGGASVDFILQADTRLSGRILDAKDAPVPNVCVDLEPLQGRSKNGARYFDCSKQDGTFEMTMMTPGHYWLVARDEVKAGAFKSTSTLYYPGERIRERATVIAIEAGKYVGQVEIRLPSDERRYRIVGRVQFADGVPAKDATVKFTSLKNGYSETTETGADGSFGFSVVEGIEGEITGQLAVLEPVLNSCPDFKVGPQKSGLLRFMDTNAIRLPGNSDSQDIVLELPSPSCKTWRPKGR